MLKGHLVNGCLLRVRMVQGDDNDVQGPRPGPGGAGDGGGGGGGE